MATVKSYFNASPTKTSPLIQYSMSNVWDMIGNEDEFHDNLDRNISEDEELNIKRSNRSLDGWRGLLDLIDKTSKDSSPSRKDLSTAFDWYGTFSDKLIDKLVSTALPASTGKTLVGSDRRVRCMKERPQLSIQLTSRNFRRMTARMSIIYHVYYYLLEIGSWRKPAFTLGILFIYSYCCLNPRLLISLPPLMLAYGVLAPSYLIRHPACGPNEMPANGPPIAPAPVPKPAPEISREFFMNVTDTQNLMGDYVDIYDIVSSWLESFAYFADESISSLIFIACGVSSLALYFIAPYLQHIPWHLIFLTIGWMIAMVTYFKFSPSMRDNFRRLNVRSSSNSFTNANIQSNIEHKAEFLDTFAHKEFPFTEPKETRVVQTFEIQTYDNDSHVWSDSIFVSDANVFRRFLRPEIQTPLIGPSSVNQVLPPVGWTFEDSSSWKVDLLPEQWLSTAGITDKADIDDDEKWIYDSNNHQRILTYRRRRWYRACILDNDQSTSTTT